MSRGIGHLDFSSLPIGGENTHTILTGHRGLPSAKLFTDLDKLSEGDLFYIHSLDKVLAYKVDQIKGSVTTRNGRSTNGTKKRLYNFNYVYALWSKHQ
ncbi:Sortase [Bacillus thuringiensis serovar israelensis ATCC 35646]|nr:Sortase [Bacillus thuringiensis serovar israelensis ATCC 35646]